MCYLKYNEANERYGIITDNNVWENDGLHCGEMFYALINKAWVIVRIEFDNKENHSHGWYLVGHSKLPLEGLQVKTR